MCIIYMYVHTCTCSASLGEIVLCPADEGQKPETAACPGFGHFSFGTARLIFSFICIYMYLSPPIYLSLNQVNVKVSGKTALHCAIRAGVASVVELLLELRADMECGVSSTLLVPLYCLQNGGSTVLY